MAGGRCSSMIGAWALMAVASGGTGLVRAQSPSPAAPPAQAASADVVARGAYIVEHVAQCGRCHTPVTSHGDRDPNYRLAGGPLDFAPTVAEEEWAFYAPRIAGTPPGTDEQILTLLTTGVSRTGAPMRRPMPMFKMSRPDAEAVLAYLKSLGGTERRGR